MRTKSWTGSAALFCAVVLAACGSNKSSGGAAASKDGGSTDAAANGGDSGPADAGGGTIPPTGPSDVWSHMGFDQKNNYFNPNERTLSVSNAGKLKEKWRFKVAGFPPGTPIVGEGKVFVMASGGTYGLDLQTGKQVWMRTNISGTASPAYEPGFVYVHDSTGSLSKLKAADGTTVWGPVKTYDLAGCDGTSSPVIAGDKVIVGHACGPKEVSQGAKGARGGVEAINKADGKKAWSYYTVKDPEDGAMVWSTVAVDLKSKAVYASSGNNYTSGGGNSDSIHAINLDDGTLLWKRQVRTGDTWSLYGSGSGADTDFGANPIIADIGGNSLVAAGDKGGAFWGVDRITGAMAWGHPNLSASHDSAHGGVLNNGAFDGKYLYCVANDPAGKNATLHVLDPKDGKDVWKRTFSGSVTWAAPSLANGLLVVPVGTKLYVLDAKDGKDIISFDTGGTIAGGAAAIVDGKIIVKSGLQYAFDNSVKNNNLVIAYALP